MGDVETVLVAGATGTLGRHVVGGLRAAGHRVRGLARRETGFVGLDIDEVRACDARDPTAVKDAVAGSSIVFSALGSSVMPGITGRAGFAANDWKANRNLIDAARNAGVGRFVYIGVAGTESTRHLPYVAAHVKVEEHLQASGLAHTIIRPTGFFASLSAVLDVVKWGVAPVIAGGRARTNPIHEAELAQRCVEAIRDDERGVIEVGGPEILSRRRIMELAFAARGKRPRFISSPAFMARAGGAAGGLLHPLHPRLAALLSFYSHVMAHDCLAPAYGQARLEDYFKQML